VETRLLIARPENLVDSGIAEASTLLRSGEVVAFPTETVYGLGANARDERAIARVFEAKDRPPDNPLIVHVSDPAVLAACGHTTHIASRLIDAFMPGPLTIVVESDPMIPLIARAGLPTVALRIPNHRVALALLRRTGPLVAPSANLSGRPSPTTARHVLDDLSGRIAAVLDGGPCSIGIESTVLDLSEDEPSILRPGRITADQIEAIIGRSVIMPDEASARKSPGTQYRHYAPAASVHIAHGVDEIPDDGVRRLILTTKEFERFIDPQQMRPLASETFYARLREADSLGVNDVVILFSDDDIDEAFRDRIDRAAGEGR
jgi:tRNA threonylcarbamoyl adenosine modification protein (Sua5/YciO/YrdC/YwlC family)